jgi:hypothetical protein
MVQVRTATAMLAAAERGGVRGMTLTQGALLPADVDPVHLRHLLSIGMVEPVDPTGVTAG